MRVGGAPNDAFGRLLAVHFPDAEVVRYHYDAGGNVTRAASATNTYVQHVGYDEFEQRTRLVSGNNVQTKYAYDPLTRRLSEINASTLTRSFQQLRYAYDPTGNIDQIQNLAPFDDTLKGQILVGPMTQKFSYDDLYQLKTADGLYQESSKNQFGYGLSQTYDAIGNILQKQQVSNQIATNNGGKVTPQQGQTYSSNYKYQSSRPHAPTEVDETPLSPNKPIARALSYDPSGNLTQRDVRSITWNEEDRVTAISDNGSVQMEARYDGAGDRAVKLRAAGGSHETFYFGPNMTSLDGEAPSKHVFLGTQRVASKQSPDDAGNQPPDVFYFHDDHLGSTNFLTDSYQNIASHEEYFPTGELWVDETSDPLHVQTPYLFTGKELDTETGLFYFGARYYDPHLGIWASADPVLARYVRDPRNDGAWNPRAIGLYTYAHNNPLRYVDPQGLQNLAAAGPAAGAGAAGGLIGYLAYKVRHGEKVDAKEAASYMFQGAVLGAAWGFNPLAGALITAKSDKDVPVAVLMGVGAGGVRGVVKPAAPVEAPPPPPPPPAFTETELSIVNEVKNIPLGKLQEAFKAGGGELKVGARTIVVEPGMPASGMTLFGENGFVVGKEAFTSEAELTKTLLHETHRLATSQAAGGVSGSLATAETAEAASFAERAYKTFFAEQPK